MSVISQALGDGSFIYCVRYKTEIDGIEIQFDTRNSPEAYLLEQAIRNYTICSKVVEK